MNDMATSRKNPDHSSLLRDGTTAGAPLPELGTEVSRAFRIKDCSLDELQNELELLYEKHPELKETGLPDIDVFDPMRAVKTREVLLKASLLVAKSDTVPLISSERVDLTQLFARYAGLLSHVQKPMEGYSVEYRNHPIVLVDGPQFLGLYAPTKNAPFRTVTFAPHYFAGGGILPHKVEGPSLSQPPSTEWTRLRDRGLSPDEIKYAQNMDVDMFRHFQDGDILAPRKILTGTAKRVAEAIFWKVRAGEALRPGAVEKLIREVKAEETQNYSSHGVHTPRHYGQEFLSRLEPNRVQPGILFGSGETCNAYHFGEGEKEIVVIESNRHNRATLIVRPFAFEDIKERHRDDIRIQAASVPGLVARIEHPPGALEHEELRESWYKRVQLLVDESKTIIDD